LDLNGTLVLPLKQERLDDLVVIPGAIEAVARLTRAGFACPVITVQSRIAKCLFTTAEFLDWFAAFAAAARQQGADLQGPYLCPHRYAEPCACKKPNPLLYERAMAELAISATDSFVIGDSPDDIRAAVQLGSRGCLVRTGWANDPTVVATIEGQASLVAPSIVEAVEWILATVTPPSRRSARSAFNKR